MSQDKSVVARIAPSIMCMGIIILWSNYLVQSPVDVALGGLYLGDWITYAAFTYPIAFLVTDTTNRLYGPAAARVVVLVGFALGVLLSIFVDARIAVASGAAFLTAHMLDVYVFDKLRERAWWQAPFISSLIGSLVDTILFWSIAFIGTGVPWVSLAAGDLLVKLLMATLLVPAFRVLMAMFPKPGTAEG
jgi:uncharacterized PurR-regulated membrane protein YhhQ (DUF165 family)